MAPETDRDLGAAGSGGAASMRPGHDGPGNHDAQASDEAWTPASMRPGHDGPGNSVSGRPDPRPGKLQ